jgi:hypothetical protein
MTCCFAMVLKLGTWHVPLPVMIIPLYSPEAKDSEVGYSPCTTSNASSTKSSVAAEAAIAPVFLVGFAEPGSAAFSRVVKISGYRPWLDTTVGIGVSQTRRPNFGRRISSYCREKAVLLYICVSRGVRVRCVWRRATEKENWETNAHEK